MWYRLVGSSLEVYDVKTKEDEPLYVVTEAPIEVWEVKGVARMSAVNFRVTVLAGPDGGLNLFAADEVDGQGWFDALTRASDWDQLASSRKVCVVRCSSARRVVSCSHRNVLSSYSRGGRFFHGHGSVRLLHISTARLRACCLRAALADLGHARRPSLHRMRSSTVHPSNEHDPFFLAR